MSCAICQTRREKRFCPAVHDRICPQCCGREREVTLDCPSECIYLQEARKHERPRDLSQLDPAELFTSVEVTQQFLYDREPLLVGLTFGIAKAAAAERALNDRDIIAALSTLARSYQTRVQSGLHYEPPPVGAAQQALSQELQKMLADYREMESKHLGYSALRDSEVLQGLVFLVRMAHSRTSGRPMSRAFLDFVRQQFPDKKNELVAASGSNLVVP